MNTTQKALTLALEWLERNTYGDEAEELFDALTAALAEQTAHHIASAGKMIEQPAQQEPVAKYIGESCEGSLVQLYDDVKKGTNFYTAPPAQRKPLTVDCIGLALDLEAQAGRVESQTVERAMLAAANGLRNIEAAHGIKEQS